MIGSSGRRTLGVALGLATIGLGVAVRVGVASTARIWWDEATVGLMGRHVLAGRFPFFFEGQAFMGAADAYLDAIPFAVFGSSEAALRLWPILLSLTHAALVGLLARRIFGVGRWATLLALLPSPFLLKWNYDARLHYDLLLVLTPLLLLLGLAALDSSRTAAARARALVVFGFLAGTGWWINLVLVILPAALAVALALRRPRRVHPTAPLFFVLGSAPFWLFAAWQGRLAATTVPLAERAAITQHAQALVTNALPIIVGIPRGVLGGSLSSVAVAAALGLLILAMALALADSEADGGGRLLLALFVMLMLLVVLVTERGQNLATDDPRYLLPLLAILPVFFGGMLARLGRAHPALAGTLALGLVVAHGTALAVEYPTLVSPAAWQAGRAARAELGRQAEALALKGLTAVYTHDPGVLPLTFVSGERVIVSNFYQDSDPLRSRQVDGAPSVAYLSAEAPTGFEEGLAAAGIRFTRQNAPLGVLYAGFALEGESYREIPPGDWTATASSHPENAAWALDRDAATVWQSGDRQRPGMWFQVDLGQAYQVGMVSWLPGAFQEGPNGVRLEASLDATRWTLVRDAPAYYGPLYWSGSHPMGRVREGRVELRFPALSARYVRITQLGEDRRFAWSIRELFVYEAVPSAPREPIDVDRAVAALRRAGVTRIYADHGVGARLAERSRGALAILPANLTVDAYGAAPSPNALPRFDPGPDTAVILPADLPSGDAVVETLRAAGWRFAAETLAGYRLLTRFEQRVQPGTPLAPRGFVVTGQPNGGNTRAVLDGRLDTRWATHGHQKPGDWFQIDLPEPTTLVGIDLDLGRFHTDYPRGLALEIAPEPGVWERLAAVPVLVGPLCWAGTHLLRDGADRVTLRFPPVRVRALRLVQTRSDPVFDWSVAELRLLGP